MYHSYLYPSLKPNHNASNKVGTLDTSTEQKKKKKKNKWRGLLHLSFEYQYDKSTLDFVYMT